MLHYDCPPSEVNLKCVAGQQGYQLLNCDDHAGFLRRHSKDPALYRPDICHQARSGLLRKG